MRHSFAVFELIVAILSLIAIPIGFFLSIYGAEVKQRIAHSQTKIANKKIARIARRINDMDYLRSTPSALISRVGFRVIFMLSEIGMLAALITVASVKTYFLVLLTPHGFHMAVPWLSRGSTPTEGTLYDLMAVIAAIELLFFALIPASELRFYRFMLSYTYHRNRLVSTMTKQLMKNGMSQQEAEVQIYSVIERK